MQNNGLFEAVIHVSSQSIVCLTKLDVGFS